MYPHKFPAASAVPFACLDQEGGIAALTACLLAIPSALAGCNYATDGPPSTGAPFST